MVQRKNFFVFSNVLLDRHEYWSVHLSESTVNPNFGIPQAILRSQPDGGTPQSLLTWLPIGLTECEHSAQCAPLKHHFEECAQRVRAQVENPDHKGLKEDCVEECESFNFFFFRPGSTSWLGGDDDEGRRVQRRYQDGIVYKSKFFNHALHTPRLDLSFYLNSKNK